MFTVRRLLLPCLCRRIATFLCLLPPPADQWNSIKTGRNVYRITKLPVWTDKTGTHSWKHCSITLLVVKKLHRVPLSLHDTQFFNLLQLKQVLLHRMPDVVINHSVATLSRPDLYRLLLGLTCPHYSPPISPGEEEQGSMAEVSYYSYEYDPDSEPFLADAEGGDHFDLPEGGGDVEQKVLLPADTQLPTLDTKNTPERWYELLRWCFCLFYQTLGFWISGIFLVYFVYSLKDNAGVILFL